MSVTTVECPQCGTRMAADWRARHVCPRGMHGRSQDVEPPAPWSLAMARRRAADGASVAAPKMLRDADGTPLPWSSALAARDRSEVRR